MPSLLLLILVMQIFIMTFNIAQLKIKRMNFLLSFSAPKQSPHLGKFKKTHGSIQLKKTKTKQKTGCSLNLPLYSALLLSSFRAVAATGLLASAKA